MKKLLFVAVLSSMFSVHGQIQNINFIDSLKPSSSSGFAATLTQAESVGANQLWPSGSTGLNVKGTGLFVGMWEAGTSTEVDTTLADLKPRIIIADANSNSTHATDVALVIASNGGTADQGVAYDASIVSYSIGTYGDRFPDMANEAYPGSALNILVSNHSYSTAAGWYQFSDDVNYPDWYGVKEISTNEDHKFGRYGSDGEGLYDESYDKTAADNPYLSIVKAAGNDRGETYGTPYSRWAYNGGLWPIETGLSTPVPEVDGGGTTGEYDCIPSGAMGKNVITVGACAPLNSFPPAPSDILVQAKSGWGPADDGRIKPDLVAPGGLTSFSTPVVSGTILLLQEAYDSLQGQYMKAATVKGLLCHTASEAGTTTGPDYQHGWGMVNAFNAGLVIKNEFDTSFIAEESLANNDTNYYYFYAGANGTNGKISLAWTDVEGTATTLTYTSADLNNRAASLVNDLDLRLVKVCDKLEYLPYTLDPDNPTNAAVKQDNDVDNMEMIHETNLDQGWYIVKVYHKGTLDGGLAQDFSLIITGFELPFVFDGAWSSTPAFDGSENIVFAANYSSTQTMGINHLMIGKGATLTLNSGHSLELSGDLGGWGLAEVTGAANASLAIIDLASNFCGDLSVHYMDMVKDPGVNFTISPTSHLYITDLLDLNDGNFITNGNLTLKAENLASREGYAQVLSNDGIITGNVNAQLYIDGNMDWRHLSSPVTTTLNDYLEDYNYYRLGSEPSIVKWDASISNWVVPSGINEVVDGTSAYAQFFGTTTIKFTDLPQLINLTGSLNDEPVQVTLHRHQPGYDTRFSDPNASDGWNLIPNPFPSGIVWEDGSANDLLSALELTSTAVNGSYYIYDPNNASPGYYSHNGTVGTGDLNGVIAPHQAVFIKLDADPTIDLIYNNNIRTSSKSKVYKKEHPLIRLYLEKETLKDEALISFNEEATDAFDNKYDAYKLLAEDHVASTIYTTSSKEEHPVNLSINTTPSPETNKVYDVTLNVKQSGVHNIHISKESIPENWDVWLVDTENGLNHNLNGKPYYMNLGSGVYTERFKVVIGPMTDPENLLADQGSWAYVKASALKLGNVPKGGEVFIYDLSGRMLYQTVSPSESVSVPLTLLKNQAIVIIQINSNGGSQTFKVPISER